MLFVLDIAVSLHLLGFNSYCTLNPANRLQYQKRVCNVCMYVYRGHSKNMSRLKREGGGQMGCDKV